MRKMAALMGMTLLYACSGSPSGPTTLMPSTGDRVILAAGDIADCRLPGAGATARILDRLAGTVITLGDNAYPHGSRDDYDACYRPTWGRHRDRTRPVPGNHEYETPGAAGYFSYFGNEAGPPGLGYYSYGAGPWLIFALNSEIDVRADSTQVRWLRAQLAGIQTACTMAYWHRPLFSSGPNGNNADMREVWRVLYEFNVDVVLTGHDHLYERFAPQDPDGRPDPARGIRQFVVGTGGTSLSQFVRVAPNSEVRGSEWGVLRVTLSDNGYRWEFVPVDGGVLNDAGAGQCH